MSHLFCQNRHADRRKAMEELSFAEYLRKEIGLDDYQTSKMQELLASFEQTEPDMVFPPECRPVEDADS